MVCFIFAYLILGIKIVWTALRNISKGQVIGGVLREFSLDVAKTLMVGDRSYDVLGAKENGLSCIGVLYGYGSKSELKDAGADYIIENVNKLTKFFEDK